MLVRDYMKMEAEKDDRTYGLFDGVGPHAQATGSSRASSNR